MKKGDLLIIICVILITIVMTIATFEREVLGDIRMITIVVDGKSTAYKYDLSDNDLIEFEYEDEVAFLLYERGKVKLEPMSLESCPKRICSLTGWISKGNEAIICLPNRIIITISGPKYDPVDIVSF